jgi:hypothetical protein
LRKELGQLKEEEKEKSGGQVQAKEKEDNLCNSITALLGNFIVISSNFLLV